LDWLDDNAPTLIVEVLFVLEERNGELYEGIIMVDDELFVTTVCVSFLIPVVDLIAGVNTAIIVIDTTSNIIINIFGALSNAKG